MVTASNSFGVVNLRSRSHVDESSYVSLGGGGELPEVEPLGRETHSPWAGVRCERKARGAVLALKDQALAQDLVARSLTRHRMAHGWQVSGRAPQMPPNRH
jgi:hypothetical protein